MKTLCITSAVILFWILYFIIDIYRWWCELIYSPVKKDEVRALRNCRNIDSKRIEVIEGILRENGLN